MAKSSPTLPKRIIMAWGCDRLVVEDPAWIEKISISVEASPSSHEDGSADLSWTRSLRNERIYEGLVAAGLCPSAGRDTEQSQSGYEPPDQDDSVAVEALRVFLGLEMPVALNFTSYSGRSQHRMSAVHAALRPSWDSWHLKADELEVYWIFSGYQLYASHHIGQRCLRPNRTVGSGHIERRLLTGQWVRWGFDGASSPPPGRQWSTCRRSFILTPSGIQRIGDADSDLLSDYDEFGNYGQFEDGDSASEEIK